MESHDAHPCPALIPDHDHDRLRLDLMNAGRQFIAVGGDDVAFEAARASVVEFCMKDLLPHLERDEEWLARTPECPEGRLLGHAMRAEARALRGAVYELVAAATPCEGMAATRVVHALLAAHAHHEKLLRSATA